MNPVIEAVMGPHETPEMDLDFGGIANLTVRQIKDFQKMSGMSLQAFVTKMQDIDSDSIDPFESDVLDNLVLIVWLGNRAKNPSLTREQVEDVPFRKLVQIIANTDTPLLQESDG